MTLTNTSSYTDTFINEKPRNGINTVQNRLQNAIKTNEDLAEYFKDRAQIEDTYAKDMMKLSKKHYILDKDTSGQIHSLWESVHNELVALSSIHSEYSNQILGHIEHPLRTSITANPTYADIHKMDEPIQRISRELEDIDTKIQKYKKNAKSEGKLAELLKQKEKKLLEWQSIGGDFFEKHQMIDQYRLDFIKSTIISFEAFQQTHLQKISSISENTASHADKFDVSKEINAFCSSHITHGINGHQELTVDSTHIQPERSISDSSLKQPSHLGKKDKKRFFSSFVSLRRKPKGEPGYINPDSSISHDVRQRSMSNSGSITDNTSLHSTNTYNTEHNEGSMSASNSNHKLSNLMNDNGTNSSHAVSVDHSLNDKANSVKGSIKSVASSQPPLIVIDSEGFSIPPPNRATWALDSVNSEFLADTEDVNSDSGSGSIMSNARIRVDIQNEAVNDEDAGNAAVALTRVATLLKEKNANSTRKLRGRREMRATNLYSVVEQEQSSVSKLDVSEPSNPFEITPKSTNEETAPVNYKKGLPEVDVCINEIVHAYTKGGEAEKLMVHGEISFKYSGPNETATPICFQVKDIESFGSFKCSEYVSLLDSHGPNIFQLNLDKISIVPETSDYFVCIEYQKDLDKQSLPLIIKPIWKCEESKSRLLIKYHKSNALQASLQDVVLVTSISGNVQTALSIPTGELLLAHNRMRWSLNQIDGSQEELIKAQFSTLEQGSPQPVMARFDIKDQLMTSIQVEQGADNMLIWIKISSCSRSVKAGKYIAEV